MEERTVSTKRACVSHNEEWVLDTRMSLASKTINISMRHATLASLSSLVRSGVMEFDMVNPGSRSGCEFEKEIKERSMAMCRYVSSGVFGLL